MRLATRAEEVAQAARAARAEAASAAAPVPATGPRLAGGSSDEVAGPSRFRAAPDASSSAIGSVSTARPAAAANASSWLRTGARGLVFAAPFGCPVATAFTDTGSSPDALLTGTAGGGSARQCALPAASASASAAFPPAFGPPAFGGPSPWFASPSQSAAAEEVGVVPSGRASSAKVPTLKKVPSVVSKERSAAALPDGLEPGGGYMCMIEGCRRRRVMARKGAVNVVHDRGPPPAQMASMSAEVAISGVMRSLSSERPIPHRSESA
mmetsp:Transcript_25804/g.84632  ORF Transcript_25804/g.84632 Transcript_25804/m.84632 type:complete len:267 (+) Transcript_25804:445-1245(+)